MPQERFDTLQAFNTLRAAGLDSQQAEAVVEVIRRRLARPAAAELVSKADLDSVERRLSADLDATMRRVTVQVLSGTAVLMTLWVIGLKLTP